MPQLTRRREHLPRPRAAHPARRRSTPGGCGDDVASAPRHAGRRAFRSDRQGRRPARSPLQQLVATPRALSLDAQGPDHGRAAAVARRPTRSTCSSTSSGGCGERGIGIIYISHHLDEVFALADRVTVLRDGQLRRHAAGRRDRPRTSWSRMMVGRSLERALSADGGRSSARRSLLEVAHLEQRADAARHLASACSAGEVLGRGRPGRRRAEPSSRRAIVGLDRSDSGDGRASTARLAVYQRAARAHRRSASAWCPRTARREGLRPRC